MIVSRVCTHGCLSSTLISLISSLDDMGFTREGGPKQRKKTEEGWNIYTEEELRLGGGGGTPLCPWDCQCCWG